MIRSTRVGVVWIRSGALWCATTAAAAGVAWTTLPTLATSPELLSTGPEFTDLLVIVCAAAMAVAAGWLWAITTDVVVRVLRTGPGDGGVAVRRPGALRAVLLAACGVVALGTPAAADDRPPVAPSSLAGLPLPDRATSDAPLPDRADDGPRQVRVRPGDSLWAIAEQRLGPRATVVEIVGYWHRIYDHNTDVIGPDPDLILPGQLLELPPTG